MQTDAPPPPPDAPTCDADLATDPAHCGRCDRDCAGGTCEAGACSAVPIVTEAYPIRAVAVTDAYLVWVTNGQVAIYRASLDGGVPQMLEPLAVGVSELTVAGSNIYYTTGDLHVVTLDGTGDTVLHYGYANACLQVIGTVAYLVNGGSPPDIGAFDFNTGVLDAGLVPPQDLIAPWGVAVTSDAIYWSGNQHGAPDGGIWMLPFDAAAPTEIVPHLANPNCITVYDGALWWPNSDDGTIMTSDLSGRNARVLATGQDLTNPPTTVAVDARFIYWSSGTQVLRLAR